MSIIIIFFFFKLKPAYEMRISDWSSDVCSSDLQSWDWQAIFPVGQLPAKATIAANPKFVRQLVAKVAPAPHAHLKPQLALTAAQDRFHLGIALKAFRHARHFLARLLAARHVAGAIKPVTVLGELLPAFHEPIGAQVRIGPHLGLLRHRIHHRAAAPRRRLMEQAGFALERRCHIARSEEHTSELQSLMRISYAVFCLKKKNNNIT